MKKFEIDRHAYYWAEKLLPSHIEKLKKGFRKFRRL